MWPSTSTNLRRAVQQCSGHAPTSVEDADDADAASIETLRQLVGDADLIFAALLES